MLLLDPDDRILLMKGRLPSRPDAPGAWFTVGGGAEPGETIFDAARREIFEETGLTGVELGPIVWRREALLRMESGEPRRFLESYVVARSAQVDLSREGWDEAERRLCDDMRWWSLDEAAALPEDVYPERLLELLPDILAGRYPAEPLDITVTRAAS